LLIPGTAIKGNLSPLGIFRAGTFGEGNYLGTYLVLIALLFPRNLIILIFSLIVSLISFSPIPIFIISILILHIHFFHKYISARNIKKLYFVLFIIPFIFAISIFPQIIHDYLFNYSNADALNLRTSSIERTDFIVAGFKMWLTHPLIGIGYGQFSEHLSEYTNLSYLIVNSIDYRYIANNNIIEILSEEGILTIIYYIYAISQTSNDFLKNKAIHTPIILIVLGIAMPSFFQIVIAVFIGIFKSPNYKQYLQEVNYA
jgi:O-antigen ligase